MVAAAAARVTWWFARTGTTRKLDRESSSFEVGSVWVVVSRGSRRGGYLGWIGWPLTKG